MITLSLYFRAVLIAMVLKLQQRQDANGSNIGGGAGIKNGKQEMLNGKYHVQFSIPCICDRVNPEMPRYSRSTEPTYINLTP